MRVSLDKLPFHRPATVTGIDWESLGESDAKRLRNLGFDEGVGIEALHSGLFGRDPLAIRIGRMQVAIRRAQAKTIMVEAAGA
ncbi:MAG TPA: FeoA family protein [Allosphingosinicella sp.]|nr:FeoA family protein [Allosphingosinicella sp.]